MEIDQLAKALAAAQAEFKPLRKNCTVTVTTEGGSRYSYAYADLATILDMVRPILAKHGIAIMQAISTEEGKVVIGTSLVHASGQSISHALTLPIAKTGSMNAVQMIGSVITYGRRYALSGMLSIASEEDTDANDTAHQKKEKDVPAPTTSPAPAKKSAPSKAKAELRQLIKDNYEGAAAQKAAFHSLTGYAKMDEISDVGAEQALAKLKNILEGMADLPPDEPPFDVEEANG